jgi:hypothetical protein
MKKKTIRMKNQRLFCLFPLIILISTSLTPTFIPIEQQINTHHTFSHDVGEYLSMKNPRDESGWPLTYHHDNEDIAMSVLTDDDDNIIAAGFSFNYTTYESDFLTVKYDHAGNLQWAKVFDWGAYDYLWDATVDSKGNIIIVGFNSTLEGDTEDLNLTLVVFKYDANGEVQWNKTLTFEDDCIPGGITTDSDDNIILTLGSGNLNTIELYCQTFKFDEQGNEIWNTTFTEDMLSFGSEVVVNDNDDIIVCGLAASFFGQGWFTMSYDAAGNLQWVQRYSVGNQPLDIELDLDGNIILTGQDYSYETNSSSWLTIKCDPRGYPIWTYHYDGVDQEYSRDLTIDTQGNIYTVGSFNGENDSKTCVMKQGPDGNEQCLKFQSSDEALLSIAIDKDDQVIVAGEINATTGDIFNGDFYIDIVSDFTPPDFIVDQPKPGNIYLFDKVALPLGKNTLIIGPVTLRIIPDNQDDVSHVEFYVDGTLMETKETPPFEYRWDESGFGSHTIEIHVYDHDLNMKRDVQSVWKIW